MKRADWQLWNIRDSSSGFERNYTILRRRDHGSVMAGCAGYTLWVME